MHVAVRWNVDQGYSTMRQWRRTLRNYDNQLLSEYGPPGAYDRRPFASLNVYYYGALMLDRLHAKLGDWIDWIDWLNRVTDRATCARS